MTTRFYICPHDPTRQAYAWCERDAEVAIGCHECSRECSGPDHFLGVTKMIDPDGELWEELITEGVNK